MSSRSEPLGDFIPKNAVGERPFEVLFELARGGMATVYLARQIGGAGFERLVALKRIHRHLADDPEVFAMASDEARLAALVRHANVVPVIDVVDAKGELILVQEYVEGQSLSALLRRACERGEPMAPPVVARIVVDALRGLHAAHEAKDMMGDSLHLVHRDISPQNLLVGTDGQSRVIDFGIARSERRLALTTRTGIVKGKLQYMAPEQIEERPVDRRADLFAMGAVLFESLTNQRPFSGRDDAAVMGKILLGEVDLGAIEEKCSELAPIVARALSKDPETRYATAAEMAKAITRADPPAEDDEVRAALYALAGADLERTRERVAGALARVAGLDEEPMSPPRETASTAEPVSKATLPETRVDKPAPTPTAKSRTVFFAAAAVLGVGAIALFGFRAVGGSTSGSASATSLEPKRTGDATLAATSPVVRPATASAVSTASAVVSAPTSSAGPPGPESSSAASTSSATAHSTQPATVKSASPKASATAADSAPPPRPSSTGGLLPNPYGKGAP
ncbi:MAG: protein kinase [Polyangiaceae bacterium]